MGEKLYMIVSCILFWMLLLVPCLMPSGREDVGESAPGVVTVVACFLSVVCVYLVILKRDADLGRLAQEDDEIQGCEEEEDMMLFKPVKKELAFIKAEGIGKEEDETRSSYFKDIGIRFVRLNPEKKSKKCQVSSKQMESLGGNAEEESESEYEVEESLNRF